MAVTKIMLGGQLVDIGVPTNVQTTDTAQTITGAKTFALGAITSAVVITTTAYTVTATYLDVVVLASASGGAYAVTAGTPTAGRRITCKKTDSSTNAVTLTAGTGQIDGAATFVLPTQYASATIVGDGTNWNLV